MRKFVAFPLSSFLLASACTTPPPPIKEPKYTGPAAIVAKTLDPEVQKTYQARGERFVVATQGPGSAEAARLVLEQGGNIIDAAVAASYAISVERPHSTGIGGGGFMLYREARTKKVHVIDFRERAPRRAKAKMYLDEKGEPIPGKSLDGMLSVATPGLVAGLDQVHQKWGKLSRKVVMAPAIDLAEDGFPVYPALAEAMADRKDVLARSPDALKIFFKSDGGVYSVGDKLVQKDLGESLRLIADNGANAFYSGKIADGILKTSRANGGILTTADLRGYRIKWREAVSARYKDYVVYSMPPPSSGGTHVIEILNLIEKDPLKEWGYLSAPSMHATAAAMQQAFADRAVFMGDPDFVKVPVARLTSKAYAEEMKAKIPADRARPSTEVGAGPALVRQESPETTHFSIMDSAGNVVVSTQTINYWFGSGVVAEGTGIVLNDEMDDFSAKPGAANVFGAIGSNANAIAPLKTPLSSMSPTIVMKDGQPVLALGAPGGTRIITCVAQTILNYLEYGLPLYESIASIRFHHQWKPDKIRIDAPGPDEATVAKLKEMGYTVEVEPKAVGCIVNAVARDALGLLGAADPRDAGAAVGL